MDKDEEMPRVFLHGFSNQNPSPVLDPLNRRNDSKSLIFNFLSKNTSYVDVQRDLKPHSQSQESPNSKTMLKSPSFMDEIKPEKKTIETEAKESDLIIRKEEETAVTRKDETPICNTKITPEHSLKDKTPLLSGFERVGDSIQDLGEDNCTSSIKIEMIPKKGREIGTVREIYEGPMSESTIVDPKLEKKIEKIVEAKVKQKVEEIVEQLVDRKVETLMTEHQNHAPIQSIESIGESSGRETILLLQKKALDKAEKLRYNEESSASMNSIQTSLKQSSIRGNTGNRFWEIDKKHGKTSAKNTVQSNVQKTRASVNSNVSAPRSRKPSLPPLNQSRKGSSRGGDSSLILQPDQNQSIETVPTKQDYSFLSYSNLQETDVRFVLNEFSEFSRVNKILEENLKRQQKVTKKHKKEKSIPISKLYDFYIPDNNRTIVHKEIKRLSTLPSNPPPKYSNSSPYLSEIRPQAKKASLPRGYYMPPIVRGASNKRRSQADTYDGNSSEENSGYVSMFVGGGDHNKSRDSRNSLDQKQSATEAFNKFYNAQGSPVKAPRTSNLLNKASQKRMNNSYIQPSASLLGQRRRSSNKLLLPKANQSVITEVSDTEMRSSHQRKGSRISSQGSQKKLTISRSSSRELIDSNQLLRAHYRINTTLERRDSEKSLGGRKNSIVKATNKSVLLGQESPEKPYLGEKRDEAKWMSTLEKQAFSFSRSKRPFIGKEIEYPGPNRYDLSTYKTMTNKKHLDMVKFSPNSMMAKNKLVKPPSKTDLREGILNLDVTSRKFSGIQRRLNSGSEIGSPFTDQSQKNSAFSSLHGSPMKRPNKEVSEMKPFTIEQVNQSLPKPQEVLPVKSQQIPTVIITKTSPEQKPIEKVQEVEKQADSIDLNKSKTSIKEQDSSKPVN